PWSGAMSSCAGRCSRFSSRFSAVPSVSTRTLPSRCAAISSCYSARTCSARPADREPSQEPLPPSLQPIAFRLHPAKMYFANPQFHAYNAKRWKCCHSAPRLRGRLPRLNHGRATMRTSVKWLSTAMLVAVAALIGAPTARAQVPITSNTRYRQSPLFSLNPYLVQYGRNLAFLGRAYGAAYSAIPPYALGYNPYPTGVPYVAPAFNPYLTGGY